MSQQLASVPDDPAGPSRLREGPALARVSAADQEDEADTATQRSKSFAFPRLHLGDLSFQQAIGIASPADAAAPPPSVRYMWRNPLPHHVTTPPELTAEIRQECGKIMGAAAADGGGFAPPKPQGDNSAAIAMAAAAAVATARAVTVPPRPAVSASSSPSATWPDAAAAAAAVPQEGAPPPAPMQHKGHSQPQPHPQPPPPPRSPLPPFQVNPPASRHRTDGSDSDGDRGGGGGFTQPWLPPPPSPSSSNRPVRPRLVCIPAAAANVVSCAAGAADAVDAADATDAGSTPFMGAPLVHHNLQPGGSPGRAPGRVAPRLPLSQLQEQPLSGTAHIEPPSPRGLAALPVRSHHSSSDGRVATAAATGGGGAAGGDGAVAEGEEQQRHTGGSADDGHGSIGAIVYGNVYDNGDVRGVGVGGGVGLGKSSDTNEEQQRHSGGSWSASGALYDSHGGIAGAFTMRGSATGGGGTEAPPSPRLKPPSLALMPRWVALLGEPGQPDHEPPLASPGVATVAAAARSSFKARQRWLAATADAVGANRSRRLQETLSDETAGPEDRLFAAICLICLDDQRRTTFARLLGTNPAPNPYDPPPAGPVAADPYDALMEDIITPNPYGMLLEGTADPSPYDTPPAWTVAADPYDALMEETIAPNPYGMPLEGTADPSPYDTSPAWTVAADPYDALMEETIAPNPYDEPQDGTAAPNPYNTPPAGPVATDPYDALMEETAALNPYDEPQDGTGAPNPYDTPLARSLYSLCLQMMNDLKAMTIVIVRCLMRWFPHAFRGAQPAEAGEDRGQGSRRTKTVRHRPLFTAVFVLAAALLFAFMAGSYPYYMALRAAERAGCAEKTAEAEAAGAAAEAAVRAARCWASCFPTSRTGPRLLSGVMQPSGSGPNATDRFCDDFLREWGGLDMPRVAGGQTYRWFTAHLLHMSIQHVAFNLAATAVLGWLMEVQYGTVRLVSVWMAAVLGGEMLKAAVEDLCGLVVGASGGMFGLLGMFGADAALRFSSVQLPLLRCILTAVAACTLAVHQFGVSSMSHVGGLLCGLMTAAALLPRPQGLKRPGSDLEGSERWAAWHMVRRALGALGVVVWFTVLLPFVYRCRLPMAAESCH